MTNNFYKKYEDAFFAVAWIVLSMYANSLCDAIKFSSTMESGYYDVIWHIVKWGVDRPALILAGSTAIKILYDYWQMLKDDWRHAIFHYPVRFKILMSGVVVSFLVWWINYEWWRNFFDAI